MFIATANNLAPIHSALIDRMEIINVNGYTLEEKTGIAQNFLPKQLKEHGIQSTKLKLKNQFLKKLLKNILVNQV